MAGKLIERTVTILGGANLSDEIDIGDAVLVAVQPDIAWDTNTISFQSRSEKNSLRTLKFEGSEIVAASIVGQEFVTFSPTKFAGVRFLKVRSGVKGASINQTNETVITLILRGIS